MSGWRDGWTNGWMNRRKKAHMYVYVCGWVDGQMHGQGQGEGAEDQSRAMRGGGTGAHRARRTLASDLHRSKEARVRQTLPGNVRNASQKTGTGLWKTARAEDSLPPANQGWERSGPGPETAPSSSHLSI